MAKTFMIGGILLFAAGTWIAWGPRIPFLGKLPGDILIRRGPVTFYFPVVTCLALSLIASLLIRWFGPK